MIKILAAKIFKIKIRGEMMNEILEQKLMDLDIPGAMIEITPEEADILGLQVETAISVEDALNARFDEVEDE